MNLLEYVKIVNYFKHLIPSLFAKYFQLFPLVTAWSYSEKINKKGKSVPLRPERPRGFQEVKVQDGVRQWSRMVVRLTALRTGCFYLPPSPQKIFLVLISVSLSRPQGHSVMGRIMSIKNSNDIIWNRTSDLPICSTAPYPLCYRGP
jgi:hypothetical protein